VSKKISANLGPAWLWKNSSICCGVLRPLNLCDVCRACVYQVKVVFVKYPDECCPHGCARHARCCSDWLEMTHRGATPTRLCAACPLLLRLAGNDSPKDSTNTAVRGMPVAAPTGWMGRWWGAAGGRSAVPCTGSLRQCVTDGKTGSTAQLLSCQRDGGRFAMYRLIENKYFETFIILMICASSLSLVRHIRYDTIRYDTRYYFNVRSKAAST